MDIYIVAHKNGENISEIEWLLFNANTAIFVAISWLEQVNF